MWDALLKGRREITMAIEAVAKKLNEPEFEIITGKTQRVLIAETEYKECIKTLQ